MSLLLDALKSAEKKRLDADNDSPTEVEKLPLVGNQEATARHKIISEKASSLSLESKDENPSEQSFYEPSSDESTKTNEDESSVDFEQTEIDDYKQPTVSNSTTQHSHADTIGQEPPLAQPEAIAEPKIELSKETPNSDEAKDISAQAADKTHYGSSTENSFRIKDDFPKKEENITTEPVAENENSTKKILKDINSPESAAEIFIAKLPKSKQSYYNTKYFLVLVLILTTVCISGYFIYELSIKPLNDKSNFRDLLKSNVIAEPANNTISPLENTSSDIVANGTSLESVDNTLPTSPTQALPTTNNNVTPTIDAKSNHLLTEQTNNIESKGAPTQITDEPTISAHDSLDTRKDDVILEESVEINELEQSTDEIAVNDSEIDDYLNRKQTIALSDKKVINHGNGIVITRNLKVDQQAEQLTHAYKMYEERNYIAAKEEYSKVLQGKPNNYDALLGFATTAQALGETKLAEQYYNILINRYPSDTYSQAALLSLLDNYDFAARTSKIKSFINSSPNTAYFHFLLGENYAKNQLWSDAQPALFDAVRLDKSNPDYSFNLAVSLDQLGKHKAAQKYYENALSLASRNPANFDLNQTQIRARQLQELGN